MKKDVLTVLVGGEAGQGVKKCGGVIASLMNELGRYVFENDDYQSLIRGGHNFSVVSSSLSPIYSQYDRTDILICLDERTYVLHKTKLKSDGVLVYDSDQFNPEGGIGLPIKGWIREAKGFSGMAGTAGVAATAVLCGVDFSFLKGIFEKSYGRAVEKNLAIANKAYESMKDYAGKIPLKRGKGRTGSLLAGNEAIALGAVAAGLKVYFAYPMTPSSSLLHFLAGRSRDLGVAVVHPENEIGVINMALGSAYAGARSMVGTSGGGFALMEEAFSLAGMTETPLVACLASRPGPSTGVPTYTSQGDLDFALNTGHGEFPRIVLSPSDTRQAFEKAGELMNLVWKFQVPGILLTEKHLAENTMTTNIDPSVVSMEDVPMYEGPPEKYSRYEITESGVSPLLFPPAKGAVIKASSYEHDSFGYTTEEADVVAMMQEKRMRKEKAIVEDMKKLETVRAMGAGRKALITYGSTTLSVLEALEYLEDTRVVQVIYLRPFPSWAFSEALEGTEKRVVVELTLGGQFERLLRSNGFRVDYHVRQYNGRPFDPEYLASQIKEVMK